MSTKPLPIAGPGSCLEPPGTRRRRHTQEAPPPADPQEKVELSPQDAAKLAVELATQMAQETGATATVEVGGIKVTISPKEKGKADPHKPIAVIDEPAPEAGEGVRPEVRAFVDSLRDGTLTGAHATTRSIPRAEMHEPEPPANFAAQRFALNFDDPQGNKQGLIIQTEAVVGHMHTVVPGKTEVGGWVSILEDANNDTSDKIRLNPKEQDYLLESLYAKFSKPMVQSEADLASNAIAWVSAVRYDGEGVEAVRDMHRRLSSGAAVEQPNPYKQWLDREAQLNNPRRSGRFPGFAGE